MVDIAVKNLTKFFVIGDNLLDGLTFEVQEGECVAILGRNGCAAMLAFDPDSDAATNTDAMMMAAEGVSTGTVTFAARDSEFGGFKIKEGDTMGLTNGKLEFVGDTPVRAAYKVAKALMSKHTSFITLIYGEGVSEEDANEALRMIRNKADDDVEISLVNGGQPVYYFILSVE